MDQLETSVRTFAATEPWQGEAPEGCFPNFLGVMTQRAFVADYAPSNSLLTVNGEANLTPAPTFNDGEIFFEQAAIHNAVMAASAQFIMVELGGGFAARTVDAHAALQRHNPLPCRFVVVEAEPTHFAWAQQHMQANGIDPDAHWLINALVGTNTQPQVFMLGEGFYGNGIVSEADCRQLVVNLKGDITVEQVLHNLLIHGRCGVQQPYTVADGTRNFDFGFISTMPLRDILQPLDHVDLMDVDIQGGERDVLPTAMDVINKKVRRIHLATHGAALHQEMWDLFFEHGWMCEVDYAPNSRHQSEWGSFENNDGILDLVNLDLAAT
ncbi:MAG: hypothetical protein HN461_04280 [Rhodospirillaceae bacterium]|nr:hypothetical protein [Rhodospirillaceae bacterium]MBT6476464.1 hypothetical protein [Rhodospirillaceae bacterium]MBT7156712.1 hypothetical protein [Rhodospirillaceae bacterium]